MNLYQALHSSPVSWHDPFGLLERETLDDLVRDIIVRHSDSLPWLGDNPSDDECGRWMFKRLYAQGLLEWGGDVGWALIFAPIKGLPIGTLGKLGVETIEGIINGLRSGSITAEKLLEHIKSTCSKLTPKEAKLLEDAILNIIKNRIGNLLPVEISGTGRVTDETEDVRFGSL